MGGIIPPTPAINDKPTFYSRQQIVSLPPPEIRLLYESKYIKFNYLLKNIENYNFFNNNTSFLCSSLLSEATLSFLSDPYTIPYSYEPSSQSWPSQWAFANWLHLARPPSCVFEREICRHVDWHNLVHCVHLILTLRLSKWSGSHRLLASWPDHLSLFEQNSHGKKWIL